MRYILIILIISFSAKSYSQSEIKVLTNNKNRVVLTAKSCAQLNKVSEAINIWEKKLGEVISTKPKCVCTQDQCLLDINDFGPDILTKYRGVVPTNAGPNCFNAALVGAGLVKSLRHTSPWEFNSWMDTKFCRKREPSEQKQPGDIISIKSFKSGHLHAFTHLTENLVYTKNGDGTYKPTYPYLLMSPDTIYNHKGFFTEEKCRNVTDKQAKERNCENFSQNYSCLTLDQYYEKNSNNKLSLEFKDQREELESLECSMENETLFVKGLNETKKNLMSSIAAINMLAQRKKFDDDQANDDLWSLIELQTESMIMQNTKIRAEENERK